MFVAIPMGVPIAIHKVVHMGVPMSILGALREAILIGTPMVVPCLLS